MHTHRESLNHPQHAAAGRRGQWLACSLAALALLTSASVTAGTVNVPVGKYNVYVQNSKSGADRLVVAGIYATNSRFGAVAGAGIYGGKPFVAAIADTSGTGKPLPELYVAIDAQPRNNPGQRLIVTRCKGSSECTNLKF